MLNANKKIYYGLYKDPNYTQPWGDADNNDYDIASTTGSAMSINIYGKVDKQIASPGTYSDRVLISVVY